MAIPSIFKKCVAEIKKAAPEVINDEQAVELLKRLNERAEAKKMMAGADAEKIILGEAQKMAAENALQVQIEKRNAAINAAVRKKIDGFLENYKDPVEGLTAYLGGVNKVRQGARLSIDAQGKALTMSYLGRMVNKLDSEGLWEAFSSGALDREVAQEMWELGRENGNPGVSKSTEAKRIAKVIHDEQIDLLNRQNNAGAFIKAREGYIVRQSHDIFKIRRAGFESWKNAIIPLLDPETFKGIDPDEFLKGAYDGLSSGIHIRASGLEGEGDNARLFGFHGPANVAKKISQNRVLHFKDANAWTEYNKLFGTASLREAIVRGFEHGSRNVALMEGLGTNPAALFQKLVADLVKSNRDNVKISDKLRGSALDNLFKTVEGTTRIPVDVNSSRIANGIRAIQSMSKLGGAVISSISDIPQIAGELRYQGKGLFEAYGEALKGVLRGRGSDEQKEIARLVGVGLEGALGDIHGRFDVQDSIPGKMSRMMQLFFKWNGLTWWTDSMRTTTALMMSNHLAEQSGKTFSKLDPDTLRIFSLYGIGEAEWNVVRATAFKSGDYKYITPDKLDLVPNEEIGKILENKGVAITERNIQREKDRIKTAFQTYFVDRGDYAVPTPGARERAYLELGTRPGTALGEAMRFVAQFKGFPLSVLMRGVQREIYGKGANTFMEAMKNGNGELMGLVHLMIASTVFGYVAMTAKDILKGKSPREPKPTTLMAAMAQGGGFGIYGDFLFGEFSRYGRSALATAAGPTLGQVDDIAELYTRVRNGEDPAAQATRMLINNTPFINLFYTRSALDYLFLYQLQETMNPGYLRRMEARAATENGQEFFFPPSQVTQ
jgi:hypothetical protein